MAIKLEDLVSPLSNTSLNIESARENIKQYLLDNEVIKDVNYLGSNISQLVDIIAYTIVQMNSNVALLSNEAYLPTATLRRSVLTKAKELNYAITRVQSAKMQINISFPTLTSGRSVTIPAFTEFTSGDYTFLNTSDILITDTSASTITLKEGTWIDSSIDADLSKTINENTDSIVIPYRNIEEDGVYFRLRKSGTNSLSDYWEKIRLLIDLEKGENQFFEELDIDTGWVRLFTYFAGQGNLLSSGDVANIGIIISSGAEANGLSGCELNETILDDQGQEVEANIEVLSPSTNGTDEESIESIQRNAPLFFNSGENLVNVKDYQSILEKNSLVEKAIVWGGETTIPTELGTTFITILPQNSNQKYLTSLERASIIKYIRNSHIIATNRKFRLPHYFYIDFDIKILGDVRNLSAKQNDIIEELNNVFGDELNDFLVQVYESKLIRRIENIFEEEFSSGLEINILPKVLLTSEMFEELNSLDKLEIFIPNSLKRFKLEKDGQYIEIPKNYTDLRTYLLDGWVKVYVAEEDQDITFSGTLNSKTITTGTQYTKASDYISGEDIEAKDIELNSTKVGYFDVTNSILYLDDLTVELSGSNDDFINITYSKGLNIKLMKNNFLKLGDITYV